MYRFLPGEFNFCMAGRDLSRGNHRGAMEMLDLAAGWGSKKAQYVLGVMHFRGDALPVDHALGLAWLTLAAERHDPDYLAVLASAMHKSTPAELQRSKDLLTTMASVYADDVAARRAQRRFDRMVRELTYYEPYDVTTCIKGLTDGLIAEEDFTSSSCPSPRYAVARLHLISDVYFDGWAGHVSVGAAEPVLPQKPAEADKTNAR
ncbi:MAG: SEL1-like repeat protein [Rhodanobacter sp.]